MFTNATCNRKANGAAASVTAIAAAFGKGFFPVNGNITAINGGKWFPGLSGSVSRYGG